MRWRWCARSTPPSPRRTSICSTRRSAAAPPGRRAGAWRSGSAATSRFSTATSMCSTRWDQARYIGPIGAGSIAKLVHNCTSAVLNLALAEVFTMGIKAGVDPVDLWEAVRQGATGRVRTFDRLGNKFLTGQHDPADFALRLLHKDVSLAV